MYQFVIYSTDTKILSDANSEIDLIAVTSDSSLSLITVNCFSGNPKKPMEGEIKKGSGGVLTGLQRQRKEFELNIDTINFKTEMATFDALYTVLNKRYKYIRNLTSYPYNVVSNPTTKVLDVCLMSDTMDNQIPHKVFKLKFHARKQVVL